jgi:hypothetical protein
VGASKRKGTKSRARRRGDWVHHDDDALLGLRICDLGLQIEGTSLERRVQQLYRELDRCGLRFRPHIWLSSEWFSPDGIPGIAVPFYLAHPRLMRLEARQMLEVEGGTAASCMKILRHEAGHAVDAAYRLHHKKAWRETFGRYSERYPQYYRPNPRSRAHVLHLDAWYAQAHPAEDWAETFAVWLTPRSNWRVDYRDWRKALRKLEHVDRQMDEINGRRPTVRSRARIDPVSQLDITLEQHYRRKRKRYGAGWPDVYDRDLKRLFSSDGRHLHRQRASSFLRGIRTEIRTEVAEWTGAHPYTIDQVLQVMIERCRELKLRLSQPAARTKTKAMILLTVHTTNQLRAKRQEIPL